MGYKSIYSMGNFVWTHKKMAKYIDIQLQYKISMKSRGGDMTFFIRPYTLTHPVATSIKQQIEYYLSLPNLITDHYLRAIINSSKGGWVKTQIIMNFKHIQDILHNNLGTELTKRERQAIIRKSCQDSPSLQLSKQAIRRANHTHVQDFSTLLYVEGIQQNLLLTIFEQIGINSSNINTARGRQWMFVQLKDKNQEQVHFIYKQLLQRVQMQQNCKILLGNEFVSFQKQYAELIGITPLQTNNQYSQAKYIITPSRILSYQQLNELKHPQKKKNSICKGKSNKTRLPRHFIYGNPDKKSHKKRSRQALIHVQGCEPKKSKKTQEEARHYRRMKIEARRRRKATRMVYPKMGSNVLNQKMLQVNLNSQE